MRVRGLKRIM